MTHRVVLAGGGTAGHVEPALAVADSLRKFDTSLQLDFLGTKSGVESALVPQRGYKLLTIPKVALPRRLTLSALTFPFALLHSTFLAARKLRGADLLIGFGGYVSASAYLAARFLRIPTVIHEANARPGWANRLGLRSAKVIAVAFSNLATRWPNSTLTGMPIRASIAALANLDDAARRELRAASAAKLGLDASRPIIAIFGGSLGSLRLNQAIQEFLNVDLGDLQIIHALGRANPLPPARPGYKPMAYFEDMPAIYGATDLLITRSGAVTCCELMTVARYAILVPLPHGNGEQSENAARLVESGIAIAVPDGEFDGDWLRTNLLPVLKSARECQVRSSQLHIAAADEIARLALARIRP